MSGIARGYMSERPAAGSEEVMVPRPPSDSGSRVFCRLQVVLMEVLLQPSVQKWRKRLLQARSSRRAVERRG